MFRRHGVEFLLVGGGAAIAHGATRPTADLDFLPMTSRANLECLCGALRELNARLRIGGLSDDEARQLPSAIGIDFFERTSISTWTTDAGDVDILLEMPDRAGERWPYEHYVERSASGLFAGATVRVAALSDIVASKEFADREKDQRALPELRDLLRRQIPPAT